MTDWRWPDFTEDEMRCKGSGEILMNARFMDRLQSLRDDYGRPMIISSGYRSPEYNAKVSHTGRTGPHTTGRAVDIAIRGEDAYMLLGTALRHGFAGIGLNQRGAGRFLHLDDLPQADNRPRPWVWTY